MRMDQVKNIQSLGHISTVFQKEQIYKLTAWCSVLRCELLILYASQKEYCHATLTIKQRITHTFNYVTEL